MPPTTPEAARREMTPLTQLNRHIPSQGLIGDCFRTCVAMLLGHDCPSKVPHFVEMAGGMDDEGNWKPGESEVFNKLLDDFLSSLGLMFVDIPFNFDNLEDALAYNQFMNPNLAYILSGSSKNGCNHSIVCVGGEVFKDPAQDHSGITSPASDGYYWIGMLANNHRAAPETATERDALRARVAELTAHNERQREALHKIASSSKREDGCYYTNIGNIERARAALNPAKEG